MSQNHTTMANYTDYDDLEGYCSMDAEYDDYYEEVINVTDEQILWFDQDKFPDQRDKALLRTLLIEGGLAIIPWRQGSETKKEIEEEAKQQIPHIARRVAIKFSSDPIKKQEMLLFAVKIFHLGHRVVYKRRPGFRLRDPPASHYLHKEDYLDDLWNVYGGIP